MTTLDAETIRNIRAVDGTGDVLRRIAGLFARDSPAALKDAVKAVGTGDAETFCKAVHGLKGSAATVGGVRLAEVAADLERLAARGILPAAGDLELLSATLDATLAEMGTDILATEARVNLG
ncbi:MAG: Hpt domain-containing protein [Acidimicrobiia bacterium]